MSKEEFKKLFIKLTEYTIPFGDESKLEKHLPSGYKKDSIGNYYYEIGKSETLFTTHLDTYSSIYEKVNHIIDKNDEYIIRTDETTILGGDNKLGCTILISMIKKGIPGTYYFFLGEEPIISGGLYGSTNALSSNTEFFKKFKRCIAFDRKEYGSIVVRQMGRMCCSKEFETSLANELDVRGIKWNPETAYGYYTDTAVFMDVIPECTNISAGGFNEHYKTEWVNLNYTYKVFLSAIDVDWESLPYYRKLEQRFDKDDNKVNKYDGFIQKRNLKDIIVMFDLFGMNSTRNITKNGIKHITFSKWLEDIDYDIYLDGDKILKDGKIITLSDLIDDVVGFFRDDLIEEIEYYLDLIEDGEKSYQKKIDMILKVFKQKDINYFLNYLNGN